MSARNRVSVLAAVLCAAAFGCKGPNSSEGGFPGDDLDESSAALVNELDEGGSGVSVLFLSSSDDVCIIGQDQTRLNGTNGLIIELAITSGKDVLYPALQSGTYQVGLQSSFAGVKVAAAALQTYKLCGIGQQSAATSGSVELLHLEAGEAGPDRVVGTYSLSFGSGATVTGRFDAASCKGFNPYLLVCY